MKKTFIAIGLIVVVAVAAWLLQGRMLKGLSGTVIDPPKPLTHMILMDYERKAYPIDLLKGQWRYLIFADTQCGDICREQITLTGKMFQGKPDNASRLLIMGFEPDKSFIEFLKANHSDLQLAVLTRSIWSIFVLQFQLVMQQIGEMPFLLINPDGFMVMGYDELVTSELLGSDLQTLQRSFADKSTN